MLMPITAWWGIRNPPLSMIKPASTPIPSACGATIETHKTYKTLRYIRPVYRMDGRVAAHRAIRTKFGHLWMLMLPTCQLLNKSKAGKVWGAANMVNRFRMVNSTFIMKIVKSILSLTIVWGVMWRRCHHTYWASQPHVTTHYQSTPTKATAPYNNKPTTQTTVILWPVNSTLVFRVSHMSSFHKYNWKKI